MRNVIDLFKAARNVSTPLVSIATSDQFALAKRLFKAVGNGESKVPMCTWDIVNGLVGDNDLGTSQIKTNCGDDPCINPVSMLVAIGKFAEDTLVVMYNAHRFIGDIKVVQAILNLREEFKEDGRTWVGLGPDFTMPAELGDVVLLDEGMPDDKQLRSILERLAIDTYGNSTPGEKKANPNPATVISAEQVDAVRGLSAFTAEQSFAMSMQKDSVDIEDLWDRKRSEINKTSGLKFSRSGPGFDAIGGLDSFKEFMRRIVVGSRPGCIVFMDEIDKSSLVNSEGDNTGVSRDTHGQHLSWMQDNNHTGVIAVGPPGSGKTVAGMSIGPELGIPTVVLDINATKDSLVGSSERNIREAYKVINGVAGDSYAFVFATCNNERGLSPELKRRFISGTWFFDLPNDEEKNVIWDIHMNAFKLGGIRSQPMPDDSSWTGAEIRNCCYMAATMKCPLVEASAYIVPVAKSSPESIESLRNAAAGRFLSASYPGAYEIPKRAKTDRSVKLA